jgi:hypothetical protein
MREKEGPKTIWSCLGFLLLFICGAVSFLNMIGVIHLFPPPRQAAEKVFEFLEPRVVAFEKHLPPAMRTVSLSPVEKAQRYRAALYDGGDGLETVDVIMLSGLGRPRDLFSGKEDSISMRGFVPGVRQAVNYLYYAEGSHTIAVHVTGDPGTEPMITMIGPDGKVLASADSSHPSLTVTLPGQGMYTLRICAKTVAPMAYPSRFEQRLATNFWLEVATSNYVSSAGLTGYLIEHMEVVAGLVLGGLAIGVIGCLLLAGKLWGMPPQRRKALLVFLREAFLLTLGVHPSQRPRLPNPPPPPTVLPVDLGPSFLREQPPFLDDLGPYGTLPEDRHEQPTSFPP